MADRSNADTDISVPGGEKADPATVFAALAEIIYQGSDVNEMYAAICIAATLTVHGCDHASLLVRDNDRYLTVGASDRLAQQIDGKSDSLPALLPQRLHHILRVAPGDELPRHARNIPA